MRVADLHTHTPLCRHAEGTPEAFVRTALERNLSFLGVSDHSPWPAHSDVWRMIPEEYPAYLDWIDRAREYARGTTLEILYSLETDWIPGKMDEGRETLEKEPFDYLIRSVHFTDGFAFDDPDNRDAWTKPGTPEKIWKTYLEYLEQAVSAGGFQILGHADLPKKFGYPAERSEFLYDTYARIFRIAAEKGIALELNTAGLHKPVGEIYPALDLLKLARNAGMKFTFGSDAHAPDEVGRDFDKARAMAFSAGCGSFAVFRRKQMMELEFV